jgi:hypothetical protein
MLRGWARAHDHFSPVVWRRAADRDCGARARLLIELAGKDRGQPWWWEGVQVLRWR